MRLQYLLNVLLSVTFAGPLGAQTPATEFAGFPVSIDMIPIQAKAPITVPLNSQDFNTRLKAGGTLVLDGNDTILGSPEYSRSGSAFLALDKLVLKNKARLITGGSDLVIFVNTLVSEDGQIIAFPDKPFGTSAATKKAQPGPPATGGTGMPGQPGNDGDEGGIVSIHVVQGIQGIIHFDLSGQEGGDGGAGNSGVTGQKGGKGQDASSGIGCNRGGQPGGTGSQGGRGGDGGKGGAGGHGGRLHLFNIGNKPIPEANYTFLAAAGIGGKGGIAGPGGTGGPGGDGGNGEGFCGGGDPGSPGPGGPSGTGGPNGNSGAPGNLVSKNLDLETLLIQANNYVAPSVPHN